MWFSAIACGQPDNAINFKWVFAEARARVKGMKQEKLAELMGIPEPQLSKQLDDGHPSLRRLERAARNPDPDGKAVVAEIFAILGEELGFGECHPLARVVVQALQANAAVVDVLGRLQFRISGTDISEQRSKERRRA